MDKSWVNVAIVGCGHIYNDGHKKTFLHPASTNNAVIAFCDPDEKRAKDALSWIKKGYQKLMKTAKKQSKTAEVERLTFALDHLKTYTSLEQMLDDLEGTLDVIDNCTPGRLHIPLSVQAMQRGVHAMTEKPPGLNWWDVKRAVAAEQATGKHYELLECVCYDRPIQQCRKVIEDGALGKILEMSVPYGHGGPYIPYFFPPSGLPHFIDPLWAGGGCVQDLAPHGISKGLWSVGPGVRAVSCETAKLERRKKPRVMSRKPFDSNMDDWAEADLEVYDPRTDSNFEMHVVTSWCGGLAFGFSIEGENGLLLIDKDHPVLTGADGRKQEFPVEKDQWADDMYMREIQIFCDRILHDQPSDTPAEYALRLQEIMSLHYFAKLQKRSVTLEEMEQWGEEIATNAADEQGAVDAIATELLKAVDLL